MQGFNRIVESVLNLTRIAVVATSVNIPAVMTDEAPDVSGNFGSGYAKLYTRRSADDIDTDFSDSGVTKQAVNAVFAQENGVSRLYVIKRGNTTAGVVTLTFGGTMASGQTVAGTVNGNAISQGWSIDMAGTLTALATAIQNLPEVATAVSNGTTTITITFEAEYVPTVGTFTVTGTGTLPSVTTATTTPAVTIQNDITNALGEADTNKWFMLLLTTTNKGAQLAAAAKMETIPDRKMLMVHTTEAAVLAAGSTDVASKQKAQNLKRTATWYHDDSTEMIHCALASILLGTAPGKISAALKILTGCTESPLSASEIAIAEGKNCNTYASAGFGPLTLQGVVANGIDIEAIRDVYYALNELDASQYNTLTSVPKMPYNGPGAIIMQGAGQKIIDRMVDEGVFDPQYNNRWTVPNPATLSNGDRAAKIFANCELDAVHLASGKKVKYTANIGV